MQIRKPTLLTVRAALTVTAVFVTACGSGGDATAASFFAPDSPWNATLSDSAALQPDSPGLVGELNRQVQTAGAWINSNEFSIPIYTVPADQPGTSVHIDNHHDMYTNPADAASLEAALEGIPIPPGAKPAAGTNRHMVIWQPSTDTMWELWQARNTFDGGISTWRDNTPGWHASWGAKITDVSSSSGVIPAPFGATASGLAAVGGLITIDDLEAGRIDHALAMAIPNTARGRFVAPATRTDGAYVGEHAIPEGTRFRLPASLDTSKLGLSPLGEMIARAAQRYGIIVRDRAAAVVLYTEDPVPSGSTVFRRVLAGQNPGRALLRFPWDKLEALSAVQTEIQGVPSERNASSTTGSRPGPVVPPPAPVMTPVPGGAPTKSLSAAASRAARFYPRKQRQKRKRRGAADRRRDHRRS
jgi:hypothetical protein